MTPAVRDTDTRILGISCHCETPVFPPGGSAPILAGSLTFGGRADVYDKSAEALSLSLLVR